MIPRSRRNLLFASEREGFVFGINADGHAKKEEGGGRERTGVGAVEREGEIGNGCVCLVQGEYECVCLLL